MCDTTHLLLLSCL